MFILLIHVADLAQPFGLRFKERETALGRGREIIGLADSRSGSGMKRIEVEDDFGQFVTFRDIEVRYVSVVDVEHDAEGQMQSQIMQQRANCELQEMLQRDPVISKFQERQRAMQMPAQQANSSLVVPRMPLVRPS